MELYEYPTGFSPHPGREVERPAAAQLLKITGAALSELQPREDLQLKLVIYLQENTRHHKSPAMQLRAGGPDNTALPDTTEDFLLSGRVFTVGLLSSLSTCPCLCCMLLGSDALNTGPAYSYMSQPVASVKPRMPRVLPQLRVSMGG